MFERIICLHNRQSGHNHWVVNLNNILIIIILFPRLGFCRNKHNCRTRVAENQYLTWGWQLGVLSSFSSCPWGWQLFILLLPFVLHIETCQRDKRFLRYLQNYFENRILKFLYIGLCTNQENL